MLKDLIPIVEKLFIPPASNDKIIYKNKPAGEFPFINDDEGLIPYVAKQSLLSDKEDRLQQVVDGRYIHSTMFPDLCPRQIALHRRTGIKVPPQKLGYNDRIVWAIGRALEKLNRDLLMKEVGRDAVIGQWKCQCAVNPITITHNYNSTKTGEYVKCKSCNHYPDEYHELPIILDDYYAVCNPDLPYFNEYNQIVSWELKSIKGNTTAQLVGFPDLEKPQASNKQQAMMQNLFMRKSRGVDAADYVYVHYTSKAHTGYKNQPWKEFREYVKDNKKLDSVNEELLEKGKIIKDMTLDGRSRGGYNTGYELPEMIDNKKVCKGCRVRALCNTIEKSKEK